VRDPQAPPPHVPPGRILRLAQPSGRLVRNGHLRGRQRLFHGKLPRRTVLPRVLPDGLVRVRLLLLQTNAGVHKLPPASSYAHDHNYGGTPQALVKILAQHPLARDSIPTLHGRLHVHGLLARSCTTSTRPRRGVIAPTRPLTQPQERPVGTHTGGRPPRPRSTSKTANFEPGSTNCSPSPNKLPPYSAAQRAPPARYPQDNSRLSLGKSSSSTSPSRQHGFSSANCTPC
jgi:hypothetical protein